MQAADTGGRTWAVLAHDRAHAYWEVIDAVLEVLPDSETNPLDWGPALLYAYAGRAAGRRDHLETAETCLNRALDTLEAQSLGPQLYGGVAGGGWLAAHVASILDDDASGAFDAVDAALLETASREFLRADYDLIRGLCGIGVYFLERLPAEAARQGLVAVVHSLRQAAIRVGDDQVTWHTPPQLLPEWQRKLAPDGYRNLGVAHGVPGIIGLLSAIAVEGALDRAGSELLGDASRWVVAQFQPDDRLPSWVSDDVEKPGSRLSWCYGELGAAATLVASASASGDAALMNIATRVADTAARRLPTPETKDACLCHGAAGNAHLFNRLFQSTGLPACHDAALRWYDVTLGMREPGRGLAGYTMWRPDPRDPERTVWTTDAGFLNGVSGMALSLLAAATAVPPRWDRVLLAGCGIPDELNRL